MKIFVTLFILSISINSLSQEVTFPPKTDGKADSYTSKSGVTIKVGDKLELGLPYGGNQFVFINQDGIGIAANLSGSIVEVTEITVTGNEKRGYKAYAKFKGYGAVPVFINLEPAINSEEILKLYR